MRIPLLSILFAIATCGCVHVEPASQQHDAFYWNTRLGRGINLGNALEKRVGRGMRLEEKYFDLIDAAGFDSVRIPVRWSAHAGTTAPYPIDKAFFARVDWAIEQTLSRQLVAVVNIHNYKELVVSPQKHEERFLALWEQIAERYSNHPATLYFEILNEPCKQLTNDLWNEYLEAVIPLIRKSNPYRTIVVGPTRWNHLSELEQLKLPHEDPNLIVTFHYYEPFQFTHQGASWVGPWSSAWLGTKWTGTEEERRKIILDLDQAVRWAKKSRVPLYMGEFGAYSKADMGSRIRWTTFVRAEAEKRGISWSYWQFSYGFGVYNLEKSAWQDGLLNALIPRSR